jgi:hypothetical protein
MATFGRVSDQEQGEKAIQDHWGTAYAKRGPSDSPMIFGDTPPTFWRRHPQFFCRHGETKERCALSAVTTLPAWRTEATDYHRPGHGSLG